MLSVEEARARILSLARILASEEVDLASASGRILREDIFAKTNWPEHALSLMDGYALAASAARGEPAGGAQGATRLRVEGEARAGHAVPKSREGTAMRIFTGAPLPSGADSVLMQEDVLREGEEIAFTIPVTSGMNVRPEGEDMHAGECVLSSGTVIGAPELGLLAQCDRARAHVGKAPKVAIVATGDELRVPGTDARDGTIPEAAGAMIATCIRGAGGEIVFREIVGDDLETTKSALARALELADIVVTIGGVSVGDHDLVKPALESLGATIDFWKVAMKPGKPLAVAKKTDRLFLGLPGNPVSAFVTWALFGTPLLRYMQGARNYEPTTLLLPLAHDYAHAAGRSEFPRAKIVRSNGRDQIVPIARQASGSVRGLALAHGIFIVPCDSTGMREGEMVEFILLPSP